LNTFTEIFNHAALPWEGIEEIDVMRRIQNREKLTRPSGCPKELYDIMMLCWKLDTNLRATASLIQTSIDRYIANPGQPIVPKRTLEWPPMPTPEQSNPKPSDFLNAEALDLYSQSMQSYFSALEVHPSSVEIHAELGRGQFGSVHLAVVSKGTKAIEVAVKMVLENGVPEDEVRQFEYEARLLAAMQHRNIVSVVGVCFQQTPHMLLLEIMSGGDLRSYLKKHKVELQDATDDVFINVCLQVAEAMEYLDRKRVVHRDLAARYD
jgi:hypothetical protein